MHITGKLRFARATHRGCAEGQRPFAEGLGVSPNFLISPKSGGPGVEIEYGGSAGGFRFPLPARRLDSRFRGNDPPEADRGFGERGLKEVEENLLPGSGVSPVP